MSHQKTLAMGALHLAAVMLLSTAVASAGALLPGLCNTGFDSTCTTLITPGASDGSNTTQLDGNWKIDNLSPYVPSSAAIPVPCVATVECGAAPPVYVPAWVDLPSTAWQANDATSEWITPQLEDNSGGQYIYSITFPVPTADGHVTISGQLWSDNEVYAIFVGSGSRECVPVAGYPFNNRAVNSPSDFVGTPAAFSINHVAVSAGGTATLYFVVRNRGVGGLDSNFTATGLRVEFLKASFSK